MVSHRGKRYPPASDASASKRRHGASGSPGAAGDAARGDGSRAIHTDSSPRIDQETKLRFKGVGRGE